MNPAICPGPNIINFKKIVSLKEMISHIYGRCSLIANNERPHMFIKELQLQINHLLQDLKNIPLGLPARSQQKLKEVRENLLSGISYYKKLADILLQEQQKSFLVSLQELQNIIDDACILGNDAP